MKLFVSVVMFCLLLNMSFTTAQTLIQDSCKKAAAYHPKIKYDFCVNSLQQDPESKTATSLEELVLASTKSASAKATNVKGIINQILKDSKHDKRIDEPLRICIEIFDDATNSLNRALKSVQSRDYRSATLYFIAALDSPASCEAWFTKSKGQKSPITNEDNILYQKIWIPLAFYSMLR